MMSQKAEALAKYVQKKNNGSLYQDLPTLTTDDIKWNLQWGDVLDDFTVQEFVAQALLTIDKIWDKRHYGTDKPMFIRACPLNPRPGVLESSPADTLDEAREIVERIVSTMLSKDPSETPAYKHGYIDPQGMLIVQPFIKADASAVAYPNSHIVFGEGHAGVTAGEDCFKIILKLGNDSSLNHDLQILDIDSSKIELEFVSTQRLGARNSNGYMVGDNYLVQLRGSHGAPPIAPAPTMPSGFDGRLYSGNLFGCDDGTVEVKQIIHVMNADDSELAWLEEQLREYAGEEGLVVSHPLGSDGTHHCGQCVKYGVPYIKGSVNKGDTFVQVVSGWVCDDPSIEPVPYDIMEYADAFMEGVDVGLYSPSRQYGWLSNLFHQYMDGQMLHEPEQTAYLAGVFAGYMVAAPYSVSLGECRHYGQKNDKTPLYYTTLQALYHGKYHDRDAELLNSTHELTTDRQAFYATVENVPITLDSYIGGLTWLKNIYSSGWSGSYGGDKYCDATTKALLVAKAIKTMENKPNKENMSHLCGVVNDCENIVHNNGFFLDKFIKKMAFDMGTDNNFITINTMRGNTNDKRIGNIFNIFYAARDAWDKRGDDIQGLHDYTSITDYANKRSKMSFVKMAKNPMYLDESLPDMYHEIPVSSRWHTGKYGYTGNDKYIPCGHTNCDECAKYLQKKTQEQVNTILAPPVPNKNLDMSMPSATIKVNGVSISVAPEPSEFKQNLDQLFTDVNFDSLIFTFKNMANKQIYNTTTYLIASAFLKKHFDIPQWLTDKLNKYYSAWLSEMPTDNTGEFLGINQWVGETNLKAQEKGMYYWMDKYGLTPHDKTFFGFVGAHMFLNKWPLNSVATAVDSSANSKVMFEDIMQDYLHEVIQEHLIIHGDE